MSRNVGFSQSHTIGTDVKLAHLGNKAFSLNNILNAFKEVGMT